MTELLRSSDAVRLSFIVALLADAGIEAIVLDHHTSIVQGSLSILPRRLMVETELYDRAKRLLVLAGEWDSDAASS